MKELKPSQAKSRLYSQLVSQPEVDTALANEMLSLFIEYYEVPSPDIFFRDLNEKQRILLFRDRETHTLDGFSTLSFYCTEFEGKPLSVVYSGDTIIRPEYRRSPTLPSTWIKTVLKLSGGMPQPLYWLLINSVYKTYRFLSVFYKTFYPRWDQPTPDREQALMDQLATEKFGSDYHPAEGVVRFSHRATPLRPGVADVTAERLKNPHTAFFVERNPGYYSGDELVCITQIHPDNFTAAGRRMAR